LIERVRLAAAKPIAKPQRLHPLVAFLMTMGRATLEFGKKGKELLGFLGLTVVAFLRSVRHPSRIQFKAVVAHMQTTGVNALPIVGLLSFLIGVVLAYQGAVQLKKFGAEIYTVDMLGVAILRELGILITSIVIAGRSGSAFTAQIGTMKVNQEVDAMQTIGLDPIDVLVLPRIIALVIVLPLLGFYADIVGLIGGAVMCMLTLGISPTAFITQFNSAIELHTFWVGVGKAPVFAYLIAMVGCFEGLQVSGSAESVGRRTTMSVVEGIFLVLVMDGVFSIIFSYLEI
ncbi:MAG: MlaE family ABC transporter permease, partial [Alphaproteobacteria bacterium]